MAVAFLSSQSGSTTSTPLVITKPTSVAVGDLLVACFDSEGAITTLSGWTNLANQPTGGSGFGNLRIYYKFADSGDVSATDYSWVFTGNICAGGIARVTGAHTTNPLGTTAQAGVSSSASPTYGISVTPPNADSLLLFCIGSNIAGASSSTWTASAYAIVTSNPSWTETFDVTLGYGSGGVQCSMAYATRPQITATGNASATLSTARESAGIMLVVRPSYSTTTTDTESVADIIGAKTLTKSITETESVVDTVDDTKQKNWTYDNKNTSSWTYDDKH